MMDTTLKMVLDKLRLKKVGIHPLFSDLATLKYISELNTQ
jgi:hypothetical protein